MTRRDPIVSGQFYPSSPARLKTMLAEYIDPGRNRDTAVAAISPHAGYVYSGHVAGALFAETVVPDMVVLLGPNHTGMGRRFAIMSEGSWATPFGDVPIESRFAERMKANCSLLTEDYLAHMREHSLEVQLPFLQYVNPDVHIVPVAIMAGTHAELKDLGAAVAKTIKEYGKPVLIVVSSDMCHYEPQEQVKKKDQKAIEKILELDSEGLIDICRSQDITMCGVFPAAVGIEASRVLGARHATLVRHATSGDVSGDYNYVVGYASIKIV